MRAARNAIEIALDRYIECGDLPAFCVEKENVGLPDRDADHVNAAGRTNDRVGDLGIGDQYVLDVCGQIYGDGFANPEWNKIARLLSLAATSNEFGVRDDASAAIAGAFGASPLQRHNSALNAAVLGECPVRHRPLNPPIDHRGVIVWAHTKPDDVDVSTRV